MIKIKNFLALLLVLFSTFSYAQLPKPAYVGSKSYSAKGSGSAGNIGTINYTIPTGVTNKNRVMIISFAGERYNPGPGTNFFRNLTNDYWDAQTVWGMNVNGNPVTYNVGWHVNYNGSTGIINTYQTWKGVAYAYAMPDNMTGTVPITFSNFRTPANANDEIACVVSVYENVKSVELSSGTNNSAFGSLYTGSQRIVPKGRTAQEIMFIVNGATTHETDLTLSSGWTTDQFVKVTNKTSTASDGFSTNEHDGIAHIIGHRNGFSGITSGSDIVTSASVTITKSSTVASTQDLLVFHALLPFISPAVTGKVVTPTLSSSISTDGGGLYVNVVDKSTGKVVAVATVDASGNFTIPAGNVAEGMQYDYMLSKNIGTVGSAAPAVALNTGWTTVAEGEGPFVADTTPDGIFTMTMTGTNVGSMRFAIIPTIDAVNDAYTDVLRGNTTASVILNDLLSDSPATIGTTAGTVSISTVTDAAGTAGAWPAGFTLNANGTIAVGSAVTPGAYTLYYKICAQTAGAPCDVATVTLTVSDVCPPDPYEAQQTWWLPGPGTPNKLRIDFTSNSPAGTSYSSPPNGFLGQNVAGGGESGLAVTHPVTGELIFVTDGNLAFRGSDGVQATGDPVGANVSAGEPVAVIPDPNGILGRHFIIFGNSAANTAGSLTMAKYDVQTNVVSGLTTLLSGAAIYEALEVIPHTNGDDYWILVNTTDQKVKSYLYKKVGGFQSTAVGSTTLSNNTSGVAAFIAESSFISWDPRNPYTLLIGRQERIGLSTFDPTTGAIGAFTQKITTTIPVGATALDRTNNYFKTGYSAALSANGKFIYYHSGYLSKYYQYNISTGISYQIGASEYSPYGGGVKLAKDGRVYFFGYGTGNNRQINYYATPEVAATANNTGNLPSFYYGSGVTLNTPNNVYWSCATCQAGTAAPALTNTNISPAPATVGDLIAVLSASNMPAGTAFTIHTSATATDTNKLADNTAIVPGTTYYVAFYDGLAVCYSPTTAVSVAAACFNDPATGGSNHDTKVGITLLKRAGAENADNWPMVRKSGHIALESNTQGFVVTRMTTAQLTAIKDANNAVEGMMSYDTDAKCLKIYDGTDWKCFSTPSCP